MRTPRQHPPRCSQPPSFPLDYQVSPACPSRVFINTKGSPLVVHEKGMPQITEPLALLREQGNRVILCPVACILIFGKEPLRTESVKESIRLALPSLILLTKCT